MFELLARLTEHVVPILIVQTSRTVEEHETNLANGASRVSRSKHLPRRIRGVIEGSAEDDKADAIDLVPFEVFELHGADKLAWTETATPESMAAFAMIGVIGEGLGLRWGGRWTQPHDPGHLEWLFPGERYRDIPTTSAAYAAHGMPQATERTLIA